ncbi:MAG: hypothetical protein AAGG44_01150 [Planctomycetota bacterium]
MSGGRRKRDDLSPSLFPFLAVLLCTMGSLVLILMLVVSGAQAEARQVTTRAIEEREEQEAILEHAKDYFSEQLEDLTLDLEKERIALTHFEEHILELTEELEALSRNSVLAADREELDKNQSEVDERLSELEKQLAEALDTLASVPTDGDGDKPIFAVIPYDGPNGTHRRPIYIECDADGLVIQPEGVRLTIQDLEPPHGPGNPLDAALRAIRSEYKPGNGAITETAYPLLLVRPSGIRTYALARSAMSGWDDQFGYELLDEEMELTFPDGQIGLQEKIVQAITLAKERQTALAMAMPKKYGWPNSSPLGTYGSGGNSSAGGGFTPGNSAYANRTSGQGVPGSNGRGGFENGSNQGSAPFEFGGASGSQSSGIPEGMAGFSTPSEGNYGRTDAAGMGGSGYSDLAQGSPGQLDPNGGRGSSSLNADPYSQTYQGPNDAGDAGGSYVGDSSNESVNRYGGSSQSGNSDLASQGSGSGQQNGGQSPSNSSSGSGSGSAAGSPSGTSISGMQASSTDGRPQGEQAGAPSLGMQAGQQQRAEGSSPLARQRGSNWALDSRSRSRTAVVRPIQLQCFEDRWLLLPDSGDVRKASSIPYEGTPEQRADQLAKQIQQRVEDWGIALTGGYWRPVLIVEVAPKADWRFNQLKNLFEGSGLEIRQRYSTANQPNSKQGVRR